MKLQSKYQTVHRKVVEKRGMQAIESGGDVTTLATAAKTV
jgi:hypothetical protein